MRKLLKSVFAASTLFLTTASFGQQVNITPVDAYFCPSDTSSYIALGAISVSETSATDIDSSAVGSNTDTLVFRIPAEYEFNPAMTVGITGASDFDNFATVYIGKDSAVFSYTLNTKTNIDNFTITGLEVKGKAGATAGSLTWSSGDAVWTGVTTPATLANFIITTLPTLSLTSSGTDELQDTLCGSGIYNSAIVNVTNGTNFNWKAKDFSGVAVSLISGTEPSGGTVSLTLTLDNPAVDGSLTFDVYGSTVDGCLGDTSEIDVIVNHVPSVNSQSTIDLCHGNSTGGIDLSYLNTYDYSWAAVPVDISNSIDLAGVDDESIPNESLDVNGGASFGTVTYTVSVTNGACLVEEDYIYSVAEAINFPVTFTSSVADTVVVCDRNGVSYAFNNGAGVNNIEWYLTGNGDANITSSNTTDNITIDFGTQSDTLKLVQGYGPICKDTTVIPLLVFGCDILGLDDPNVCEGDQLALEVDTLPANISPTFTWAIDNTNLAILQGAGDQSTETVSIVGDAGSTNIRLTVNFNGSYQIVKPITLSALPDRLDISSLTPNTVMCGEQGVTYTYASANPLTWSILGRENDQLFPSGNDVSINFGANNGSPEDPAFLTVQEITNNGCQLAEGGIALNFVGGGADAYNIQKDVGSSDMNSGVGSISMWVRTPLSWTGDYNGSGIIYYGSINGTNGYGENPNDIQEVTLAIRNNKFVFDITQDDNAQSLDLVSTTDVVADQWYHLAITWNTAGNLNMYINGGAPEATTAHVYHNFQFTERHRFGRPRDDTRRFVGEIDNVSLWTKELSQAEVNKYMNQDAYPQDGLFAYYPFDPEDPLADASGNGYNLATESVSPTYEVSDYYDDVFKITIDPFTFSINVTDNTASSAPFDGALEYESPVGKTFIISDYDWSGSSYDGNPIASGLETGESLDLTVTNSAGCEFTVADSTVGGNSGLLAGEIKFIVNGSPLSEDGTQICEDTTLYHIANIQSASEGVEPRVYSWYYREGFGVWKKFPNENGVTFEKDTLPFFNTLLSITRVVVDGNGDSLTSNVVQLEKVTKTPFSINSIDAQHCENAGLVTLSASVNTGSFLDFSDGFPYVVDNSGPKLDPSLLDPEGSGDQPIIYENIDGSSISCPNYDTLFVSRIDTLRDNEINFTLPANLSNTVRPFLFEPTPNTTDYTDFSCLNCNGSDANLFGYFYVYNPIMLLYEWGVGLRPQYFESPDGNRDIMYTHTDVNGCSSRKIKSTNVTITEVVVTGYDLGGEYCDQSGPIEWTISVSTSDSITDVYFVQEDLDPGIDGTLITNVVKNTKYNWTITIDPTHISNGESEYIDTMYIDFQEFGIIGTSTSPEFPLKVFKIPELSINSANLQSEYCLNDPAFTISTLPLNANYTISNSPLIEASGVGTLTSDPFNSIAKLNGTDYDPSTGGWSGVDTLRFEYVVESSAGIVCTLNEKVGLDIKPLPVIEFQDPINQDSTHFCKNDSPFPFEAIDITSLPGFPGTGFYGGNGINTNGEFDPKSKFLTPGIEHSITYTHTNTTTNCTTSASTIVVVDTVPYIEINIANATDSIFCFDDPQIEISGMVGDPNNFGELQPNLNNGKITGDGIISNNNTSTAMFLASNAGVQDTLTTIQYKYTDGNQCFDSTTIQVYVRSLPTPSINKFNTIDQTSIKDDEHIGIDWCQEDDKAIFEASNLNDNDNNPGGATYQWFVNNILRAVNGFSLTEDFGSIDDDSLNIRLVYSDEFGCTSGIDSINFIHASPNVIINEPNHCLVDSIGFSDNSSVITAEIDSIRSRFWDFGDPALTSDTITLFYPQDSTSWKYDRAANYTIQLTVTTIWGCQASITNYPLEIQEDPIADFSWINDCIGVDPKGIKFTNKTNSANIFDPPYTRYHWSFEGDVKGEPEPTYELEYTANDKESIGIGTNIENDTVFYIYTEPNLSHDIFLVVESHLGCNDTIVKTLTTREYLKLEQDSVHFADFETGTEGWFIDESAEGVQNSDWYLGDIDATGKILTNDVPGNTSYYVGSGVDYLPSSKSFVKSGCYDLTGIDRPMIKLDYISNLQALDGVVLQYSFDFGETWANLGRYDGIVTSGINWYNSALIAASPGGAQQGWTNNTIVNNDFGWKEARHTLNFDGIENAPVVRFRLAFASNESGQFGGFAFDNIWIGRRNRLILAEHFINTSNPNSSTQLMLNGFMYRRQSPLDVIDIEYPVGIQSSGIVNRDLVGQKSSDYGYITTSDPYTIMDGNVYLGASDDWMNDSIQTELRALVDAPIEITHDNYTKPVQGDNFITFDITLEAVDTVRYTNIRVKGAVIETVAKILPSPGGDSITIRNMMRNSFGFISGEAVWGLFEPGDDTTLTITSDIRLVEDKNNIGFVIYLQDEDTEEILQSYIIGDSFAPALTPLEDLVSGDIYNYLLFPNPAVNETHVVFDQPLKDDYDVTLVNSIGNVVDVFTIEKGSNSLSINTANYNSGMYILYISNDDHVLGVDKLVIQK